MSFTVRKVEDPTIYVRRNIKTDISGISSAWDDIVDIKQSLSRLEGNVVAAKKQTKVGKNSHSSDGKVLKEISRETQQLGKVTRFQLLDEKPRQNDYSRSKFEARKLKGDWSDISSIPKAGYSGLNQGQDGYSPTRYASGPKTGSTIHRERPTFFETTTIHPTILNDPHPTLDNPHPILNDLSPSKDSTLANTSANSSSSQQFSITSSPSFHGKTVLARNEAALEKIKEKVRKQREMRSKPEENRENVLDERKLHESTDHVATTGESHEKSEVKPAVPLKRKIGTISAAGPTYKGFNPVSEPKQKKFEKPKLPSQAKISKGSKDRVPKSRQNAEKKSKNKMTRIVGSKRPQEVITTTSWRDGQANVKRILNAKKAKTTEKQPGKGDRTQAKADKTALRREKGPSKNDKAPTKTNQTYDVESNDELSEGRLSSDDEDVIEKLNAKIEKFEAEKDVPHTWNETIMPSEDINVDSEDEKESKMKEVLSKEAQSMLTDLAQYSSDSESEERKVVKDEKPKSSPSKKQVLKNKKPAAVQKPTEDVLPKGKTRHYDQAEVQKYMAHQLAERKKKQKEEKMQQKKKQEEKQQRLKELFERQKKSFAPSKKDKRIGRTFSFGNFDIHVPGQEELQAENNQEFLKDDQVIHSSTQNESDKENTDIDDEMIRSSHDASSERYTDDADVTLTEEIVTGSRGTPRRRIPVDPVVSPAPVVLDQRTQRLTALQATALALQSRLHSHALRLSGTKDGDVPQLAGAISAQPKEIENGFQGALPGVTNIRKQADENEKQSTRVAAATKIQAAYRGHTVRKRHHWTDGTTTPERHGNTALTRRHDDVIDEREMKPASFPSASHETIMDEEPSLSEGSSDGVQFTNIRPFYKPERLNNNGQHSPLKVERKFQFDDLRTRTNFHRNDFSSPVTHFRAPPVRYEPRGERFSVMNIFSRRHPTLPVDDILNEEPGSETASLLEVEKRKSPDQNMEYEDDFTDVEMSSEGDLRKDASKAATYSECFETDEDTDTKHSRTKEKSKGSRSSIEAKKIEEKASQVESRKRQLSQREDRNKTSPLSQDDHMSSPDQQNDFILPVMASTMQPDTRRSPSISPSEESEPIRRRPYIPKPVDRSGGDRLSPDSLQRKLTAEINLLENVEDSVRQVSDIERTRAISLAQQETVSLAQILKAKQQAHEHEMQNLALKAKEEASQAAKDLEKTRQAAAMAATSAAERLAEVQTEAIKTNTEHSRKYMEEATKMTSGLLTNTSTQLAEFCRNLTNTTSAAVQDLHKTKRPTTTLVERATSISERYAMNSEHSNTSDDRTRTSNKRTRTSDVISSQSKSLRSSASARLSRQQAGYSSDEFESYESQTAIDDGSEIKLDQASLSAESIAEDIPEKSISEDTTVNEDDTTVHEDDTTVHDESGNDARDALPREPSRKGHDSVSSVLDYSSQFDDSSHPLTDEDIDFNFLLPSREHRRKSLRRMKDISFDEDKRKEKSGRTPFESDDSFGKFTADMMQQYVHEEEVRTKHQAAILRLREKSLKEKTKAELQWLEQMKKQSRNKGSDDVMPSIKKRERGIRMKLKQEKEEIKCLRAANRAASFQRRFMVYQQQEIQRLHQANLVIRERIEKDTSKKGSDSSSREPSQSHPKTSSPVAKPNSQSKPSSSSKSQANQSPSAKSVSEDISGQQGSSQVSPNTTGSSFPSYGTPEDGKQRQPSTNDVRGERETSTILSMLSTVDAVTQRGSIQKEELLKIQKMLLERQQKLVKDESEVNTVLRKVTEMLKNQRNLGNQSATAISEASQSKSNIPEVNQSGSRGSDTSYSRHPNEQSIPEAISSIAKSVSEEVKEESTADKTAHDYENATFESDDSSPRSRKSVTSLHLASLTGEVNAEDEVSSLTETSDHSDVEERVRRLHEVLEREKKKAEALERKKRKIKRNQAKKEALKLEIEIKNTRDDINRTLAEIKTATEQSPTATKPPKISPPQDAIPSTQENREKSSRRSTDYTLPASGNTSLVSDKVQSKGGVGKRFGPSDQEVEESLIEVLDDNLEDRTPGTNRHRLSETSPVRTVSETTDIPEEVHSDNEREESIVEIIDEAASAREVKGASPDMNKSKQLEKTGLVDDQTRSTPEPVAPLVQSKDNSFDIPEEISELSRKTASIPEEVPSVAVDEESRKSSEIPEELSERPYTPIPSDASDSESSKDIKETHSKASRPLQKSPKSARDSTSKGASYSYDDDTFENSYTEPKSSASVSKKSQSTHKHEERFTEAEVQNEKTSLGKSLNISEHLTSPADESPNVSEHLIRSPKGHASASDDSDSSISEHSMVSLRKNGQSESEAIKMWTGNRRKRSDASDISNSLHSDDEISQKSKTSPRSSRTCTEDEKSNTDQQVRKPSPEQRAATKSDDEKPMERVKCSPRVDILSPDKTGSPSEASSIAEEISDDHEDGDISESGAILREQQSDELFFGDTVKDERKVDESGLDGTELDLPGLDESGLDKLRMKDYHLDITELDQNGSNEPEKNGTELDGSGLDEHELHETELVTPVLPKLELNESEGSGMKQRGDYTEISRETAADVFPVKQSDGESGKSSKSSISQSLRSRGVGENEPLRVSGDELQYSDDFDEGSIQDEISEIGEEISEIGEEISEIGEEISENAEDSDKGENFAVFVSNDGAMEGSGDSAQRTDSRELESESRAKHVVDDITNDIYRHIIADSLSGMKTVKSTKSHLAGNIISEKNELQEYNKTSLTKIFSKVTRKLVDDEGPLDTREVISTHDGTQGGEHTSVPPLERLDADTDRITRGHTDTIVGTVGQTTTDKITEGYLDTKPAARGETGTEESKGGQSTTDSITKDLLADAIMQMIQINQRKKEKNVRHAPTVETKPLETKISQTELSHPTGKKLPENITDAVTLTGTTSSGKLSQAESPAGEEAAIDNALKIAKTNQILDDDALRSIDDDIAGLLGTSLDDEDEFPVNITNFGSDIPSDNEASLPEYSPMLAVPHSIQELTPMVNASVDVLLEQRRLERPLKDCIAQEQYLAGETENDLECVSIQSYRHLVFDVTKEVFIDTISQNEPATRPPWAKAKWKSGQKLSRHFKRWKSDEEIRAAVLERVTNVIGLGAPRATMATIPRKTPVRGNKKDNVDAILIEELRQEEPLWTDYEEDETNVKFQVADAILNMMLEDTARVFNAIQTKKHVPDDVLVV